MKLTNLINKLGAFEPDGAPFISLYLDTRANDDGREDYRIWIKKEISEAAGDFAEDSDEAKQINASIERIQEFLDTETDAAANGIAVFAASGGSDFFETVQVDEPFQDNRLLVSDRPHLFPLVRMVEQNPRYAVLWADTNKADIYVFGGENNLNIETETEAKVEEIQGDKTGRTKVGGWSQARYQRRIENFQLQHAKETVEELEKLMSRAKIEHLVLCGDETAIMPLLRPQLSKETEESVVAVLHMSQYDSEQEIREKTHEAMGIENAVKDKERVERVFNAAKSAAGLGTLGVEKTLAALSNGQVEELVISSGFDAIKYNTKKVEKILEDYAPGDDNSASSDLPAADEKRQIADELIIRALNSAAKIVFVEDGSLLQEAGGVGAVLRYNVNATAS
jgi:peptide subunit release factor 1 (eRF1)